MEVLYSKKMIEIRLDKAHSSIEFEWKQPTTIKKTRDLLEKIHDFFVEYKCNKINNIMVDMGVLPEELVNYINNDWMPKMIQSGLKFVALVVPKSAAADYSVEQVREEVTEQRKGAGVEESTFMTIEEARAWIANK